MLKSLNFAQILENFAQPCDFTTSAFRSSGFHCQINLYTNHWEWSCVLASLTIPLTLHCRRRRRRKKVKTDQGFPTLDLKTWQSGNTCWSKSLHKLVLELKNIEEIKKLKEILLERSQDKWRRHPGQVFGVRVSWQPAAGAGGLWLVCWGRSGGRVGWPGNYGEILDGQAQRDCRHNV